MKCGFKSRPGHQEFQWDSSTDRAAATKLWRRKSMIRTRDNLACRIDWCRFKPCSHNQIQSDQKYSMSKKLSVPVLSDHILFDVLRGKDFLKYLGFFRSPGSIPPTKGFGCVNNCPESYHWLDNPIITGTLRFSEMILPRYTTGGMVMTNVDTGASYFMLPTEFKHMLDCTLIDHNTVTGSWSVIKQGHTYSLSWITAKACPE